MTGRPSLPERLPRREREIVNAIIALGNRASAEAIRLRLVQPPTYSAVRAMLARLERKGHIRHERDGLRYLYSIVRSPAAARRAALRHLVDVFFSGSRGRMMTSLLRQEAWTHEELDALQAEIDRVRKGQRHW